VEMASGGKIRYPGHGESEFPIWNIHTDTAAVKC
jgi:hypothetical protein